MTIGLVGKERGFAKQMALHLQKDNTNDLQLAMSILFLLGHCATMEHREKMCGKKRKEWQQIATNVMCVLYVAQEPLQILWGP